MKLVDAVGKRLSAILKERNITVYAFIKNNGLARSTIHSLLKSRRDNITLKSILEITDSLNMTITEFFNDPLFDNMNLTIE